MTRKRDGGAYGLIFIVSLLLADQLAAEMSLITRFKKVTIPVDLLIENAVLPQGTYDLEFLKANPLSFYLRIMKKGKILHLIQGKEFPYDPSGAIPRKTQLKMSLNKAGKILILVFESGADTEIFAKLRSTFHIHYREKE